MHLVDDQQATPATDLRQDVPPEVLVGQPLGRDEQQVDIARCHLLEDAVPVVAVRAVDRDSSHPHAVRRLDLVAHERKERRHEQGRPASTVAKHPRGDEVDGALPPAGALDEQDPLALHHQSMDDLQLLVTEVRG